VQNTEMIKKLENHQAPEASDCVTTFSNSNYYRGDPQGAEIARRKYEIRE